ncbi:hypothetical protein BGZ95_003763 [Linnemannia exigua]|uniref:HCP-like protein n=1 Tax=Linnemannia exigua TaxID=604196 RepID=A0AAD4DI71_9FUNG|nr:hypothetical protein BGZ95_003763 [Linnemannia exigua]
MENELPQVQAVRPVNKDGDSMVDSTTAPKIMHFDCHVDPITKKEFVLWDDIRLAFSDALYVLHQAKVVPFMNGMDFMPLQPLRIAAMSDVVLDIVVEGPLVRTDATLSQGSSLTTIQDSTEELTVLDVPEDAPVTRQSNTIRRNPMYGHEDTAMGNYSHTDILAFGAQPRAPQYIPHSDDDHYSNDDESTDSPSSIYDQNNGNKEPTYTNTPLIDNRQPQAPQDHTAAADVKDISSIVMKATLGDINSQVQLGYMHKIGDGVDQDYEAARYWYLKAANQGNAVAQSSIGDLYRLGLGVIFNHSTALRWYQMAADQGDASGQCNMGRMCQYGLSVKMDYTMAIDWYRKSANQGYAPAQCSIGNLYYKGLGVTKDYSTAQYWYLLAANQDLPEGQFGIALIYHNGHGVAMDKHVALEWFRKIISRRDTDGLAQFCMGHLYFEGLGRPQDYSKAHEWYLKSSRYGIPEAQVCIAYLYLIGRGVLQDYSKAMEWLCKAADQNIPEARYGLGVMYHHGLSVPKDYSIAKTWYSKAASQEQPDAKEALAKLQQLSRIKFWLDKYSKKSI